MEEFNIRAIIIFFKKNPHLPHSSATSKEDRAAHREQLLHQVTKADSVSGGHQHLKKGLLTVVVEWRDDCLPRQKTLVFKVHVQIPKRATFRNLSLERKTCKQDTTLTQSISKYSDRTQKLYNIS